MIATGPPGSTQEFVNACFYKDIITAEFVGSEVRKDGYKRLILSWIRTCPGWLEAQVQVPVRIEIFSFNSIKIEFLKKILCITFGVTLIFKYSPVMSVVLWSCIQFI